jgi:hypothetical protein
VLVLAVPAKVQVPDDAMDGVVEIEEAPFARALVERAERPVWGRSCWAQENSAWTAKSNPAMTWNVLAWRVPSRRVPNIWTPSEISGRLVPLSIQVPRSNLRGVMELP